MSPPASAPDALDLFLDRLAEAGYAVGVRERLTAYALLQRLAASRELPEAAGERLRLLRPLLSRNEHEQRRFDDLVDEHLAAAGARERRPAPLRGGLRSLAPATRRRAGAALLASAIAGWLAWQAWPTPAPDPAPGPEVPADTSRARQPAVADTLPASAAPPIYVPVGSFPVPEVVGTPRPEPDRRPLRWAVGAVGAILALLLTVWGVRRLRGRVYLQGARTAAELDEHVLRDPAPVRVELPEAQVRPVSRMLRQRVAGSREEFDLRATLRATVRAGGALTPRFRAVHRTPEYLVLVDRASANDHQAAFHERMVDALHQAGVAIDLFHFDGSPAHGCWRPRADDRPGTPRGVVSFAQLSNRHGGHRLLLFGDAAAAVDAFSGRPAEWTRHVPPFPARAWFSPLPPASWGSAETAADALGFLVLPAHPEALESLAEWLATERATLRAHEDWPGVFPPTLRGSAAAWVSRQAPPDADDLEDLLFELRNYLGEPRFQWLCACAVFPSLSWPLTLALGKEVLGAGEGPDDVAALARGVAALGALPWFRYGRMPDWLREALLDRVEAEREAELRALVERRLSAAIKGAAGEKLADVAVRRRLAAWFARRSGMARDVLLAGFLEKGLTRRLAQRMPEAMRRLLFRDGKVLYGVRGGVVAGTALVAALCLTAALVPGAWESLAGPSPTPLPEPSTQAYAELRGHAGEVADAAFSPDGSLVATAGRDGTVRIWPADGTGEPRVLQVSRQRVNSVAFSPDGTILIATSSDGVVARVPVGGGPQLAVFRFAAGQPNDAAFSPDGRSLLIVSSDGSARILDTTVLPWRERLGVNGHGGRVNSGAFSRDGRNIVTVSDDGTAEVWSVEDRIRGQLGFNLRGRVTDARFSPDGRYVVTASAESVAVVWPRSDSGRTVVLRGHRGAVYSADFSPDGRRVATASEDGDGRIWNIDAQRTVVVLTGHTAGVRSIRFSPDGERAITASEDGTARLWGRRPGTSVRIAACGPSPATEPLARAVADTLASDMAGNERRYAPAAYSPAAWDSARFGSLPRPGEVRFTASDTNGAAAATRLVERLRAAGVGQTFQGSKSAQRLSGWRRVTWQVVASERTIDGVVVGACTDRYPFAADTAASARDTTGAANPQQQAGPTYLTQRPRTDVAAVVGQLTPSQAATPAPAESIPNTLAGLQTLVDVPPATAELRAPTDSLLLAVLGRPGELTQDCSRASPELSRLLVTRNVGPFTVSGLRPAVDALERIFARVREEDPGLYRALSSYGMICVRVANGMVGRYSTHSWGTAIDIRIAGQTDRIGDGRMFAGLAALGPYFEREGFYWGARRGGVGEESSHFEVSAQLLQQWASSGQLR